MGVSLDASLAAEEAAEQAVLAQLRNRAACLENDVLRQALDGLPSNSKACTSLFPLSPIACSTEQCLPPVAKHNMQIETTPQTTAANTCLCLTACKAICQAKRVLARLK